MTISMPLPPHRLERLSAWMEDEKLDCTVVFGADNVNHLCGYWRYFGGPSGLVVGRDGERTLVVMLDEARIASELAAADEVIGFGERGFGIELDPVAGLIASVAAVPVVASARRIGVSSELPGADGRLSATVSAEIVGADDILYRLRLIKDEDELEKVLTSYELCWIGHQAIAEAARPGVQEIELFTAAQSAAQIASGGPIEFVCDLLSGPNAAEVCCPIRVAGRRAAEEGDAIVADVVVRSNGYWGDSAETHVAGSNDEVEAVRAELLTILDGTRAELVPGAKGSDLFRDLQQRILSTFPGGEFPHHGGHAIGLTGFEDPHIIPSDMTPLEPWMVLAVEPGVYFPGRYGARVENVFIVTPDGGLELRQALAVSHGRD
jgi:Xaa-Pro aminopeptidase